MTALLQQVNYGAVVVSGVLALVLGFAWMTLLWGKPYRKYMYGSEDRQNPPAEVMALSFGVYIFVSFITSLAYAVCLLVWKQAAGVVGFDAASAWEAFAFTMLLCAGYTLPFTVGKKVWQFKSWIVVAIDASYEVVRFTVMFLLFWHWI